MLVAIYAIFALSATARAGVQLATQFHQAPLAYLLSAFSGVVYILATIGLARTGPAARRLAWTAVLIELVGVLVVGSLSVFDAKSFPRATVWSGYGAGYGWVPLVLPLGLQFARAEPTRWGGAVIAVAAIAVGVVVWRLLSLWGSAGG